MPSFAISALCSAEPTRLSLITGTSRRSDESVSRLWTRLGLEQSLARENFFLGAQGEFLSLLSAQRSWGARAGAGASFSLGSGTEWLPSVWGERSLDRGRWDLLLQSEARYSLWALVMETQVALTPFERDSERRARLRQFVGMSLGTGQAREDFVGVEFEFEDVFASSRNPSLRRQHGRVGLVLSSQVEF